MRDGIAPEKLEAHRILDLCAAGVPVPDSEVLWALWMTGDLFK